MSNFFLWLAMGCAAILAVIPWFFIINKVYADGVIGRAFLGSISVFALGLGMQIKQGWIVGILPETSLLIASLTGFLIWHLWRFHRRVLRRDKKRPGGIERRVCERRFQGG
jgi:uncharacterized membrane protein